MKNPYCKRLDNSPILLHCLFFTSLKPQGKWLRAFGPQKRGPEAAHHWYLNPAPVLQWGTRMPLPSTLSLHCQHAQALKPLTCLCPLPRLGRSAHSSSQNGHLACGETEGDDVSHMPHKHLLGFCWVPRAGTLGTSSLKALPL